MDKKSLKLLSGLIVNEAKISDSRKLKFMKEIENASEKELINFLKVNEALLQEIRPKWKTAMSAYPVADAGVSLGMGNVSAAAAGAGAWVAYRAIRAHFNDCTKKCGTFNLNTPKRQACLFRCQVEKTNKAIALMKKNKVDPAKIAKMEAKLKKLQKAVKEYIAYGNERGKKY